VRAPLREWCLTQAAAAVADATQQRGVVAGAVLSLRVAATLSDFGQYRAAGGGERGGCASAPAAFESKSGRAAWAEAPVRPRATSAPPLCAAGKPAHLRFRHRRGLPTARQAWPA
jgi:hypothetical protein